MERNGVNTWPKQKKGISCQKKKIAEMEEELRKARIIPTETAGTNIGESLIEERLHTLPSEGGGGNGRGPPRPPNVAGAPNPDNMT